MKEVFKDIPNYEGLYRVSNLGNIYNVVKKEKNPDYNNGNGYMFSVLYKDKTRKQMYVHRLVAISFIPNPFNKSQINHKDFVKNNNVLTNLEWCTPRENNLHRYKYYPSKLSGRGGENHHNNKKVGKFNLKGRFICAYPSITIASKETNSNLSTVSMCCNNTRKTSNNFIWRYI